MRKILLFATNLVLWLKRYAQKKEGIDFEESFAPVARLEAVRIVSLQGFVDPSYHPDKGYVLESFLWSQTSTRGGMMNSPTSCSDHAGCLDSRKSTLVAYILVGDKLVRLVIHQKAGLHFNVSAEAEYSMCLYLRCCVQVSIDEYTAQDYASTLIIITYVFVTQNAAIAISCNPVQAFSFQDTSMSDITS
ncbi:hypothetical protein Tco_0559833 [Tanacetum coccineum]